MPRCDMVLLSCAATPRSAYLELPIMVRLVLGFLKDQIKRGGQLVEVHPVPEKVDDDFRADAKAEPRPNGTPNADTTGGVEGASIAGCASEVMH